MDQQNEASSESTKVVDVKSTRYAVRWTQPNGVTGLGDNFATSDHAWDLVRWLDGMEARRSAQYRIRYTVEPVA